MYVWKSNTQINVIKNVLCSIYKIPKRSASLVSIVFSDFTKLMLNKIATNVSNWWEGSKTPHLNSGLSNRITDTTIESSIEIFEF